PTENEAFATVNSLSEADNILEHIPDTDTRSRLYKSWIESWRLHSWGILPGLGSFSSDNKIPGLSQATGFVILEDILSRNSVNLEYTYFINEGENSIKIDWSTAPAFPVFNVGLEQRNRFRYLESGSLVGEYKEHEARAGIRVPLLTFKNNFSFQSRLQADVKGI